MSCPIIEDRNSQNWKDIENKYGEYAVFEAWSKNNNSIPTLEQYENKLRPKINKIVDPETGEEKINSTRETYQESLKIASRIIDDTSNLETRPNPEKDGEERYFHKKLNKFIKGRVTDIQKWLYLKNKTKQQRKDLEKKEDSPKNVQLKDGGTLLHGSMENIINSILQGKEPERPFNIPLVFWTMMVSQVSDVIEDARKVQNSIDPSTPPLFLTESTIFDEQNDIAGSMDLLVIFSDKSAGIYDWKFRNLRQDEDGKVVFNPLVEVKKIDSWDAQISKYSKMLVNYGINKIRRARIVPIMVSYSNPPSLQVVNMITPSSKISPDLRVVPVAKEYVGEGGISRSIETLRREKEEILIKVRSRKHTERDLATLDLLNKALDSLLVEGDLDTYIDSIEEITESFGNDFSVVDESDPNFIPHVELQQAIEMLGLFLANISESYSEFVNKESDYSEEDYKLLKNKFLMLMGDLTSKKEGLLEVANDRIKILGDKEGVAGILKPQKEMGLMTKWFTYLSGIKHPFFRVFNNLTKRSQDKTRRESENFILVVEEEINKLSKWASAKGFSLQEAYNKLINPNTENLITKYKSEYYAQKETHSEKRDILWVTENLHMTKENREKMLSRRQAFLDKTLAANRNNPEKVESRMSWWDSKYNIDVNNSAYYNLDNYFLSPTDEEKWKSDQWKYLEANQPLKDFYDFHVQSMSKFEEYLDLDQYIGKNFIPKVRQDLAQKIFSGGIRNITKTFASSLEIQEDDEVYGNVDQRTGKKINSIPKLYLNEIDAPKSFDLGRNLALFATMAYNYKHTAEIENEASLLKFMLMQQDQIMTDWLGHPFYEDLAQNNPKTEKGNQTANEAFERFYEKYIYGRSLSSQEKDYSFMVNGRRIAGTSIVQSALSYSSAVSLSFNFISAGAAFGGAWANTLISGGKNTHYTATQVWKATADLADIRKDGGRTKVVAIWDQLGISQENMIYRKTNDLASKRINKYLTMEKMFILHTKVEEGLDMVNLGAMLRNYGVDSKGKIKRLQLLPKNTVSLWDSIVIKGDEIYIKNQKGEPLNEAQSLRLRSIVKQVATYNKGNASHEDINLIQTHIFGKMLMQYRNWIPAMASERFRDTQYDELLEEVQFGRFRVFLGELIQSGFIPTAKELLKITGEMVRIYKPDGTFDTKAGNFFYQKFLTDNPDSKATKEEFLEGRKAQLRAFVFEIMMYSAILPFLFAAIVGGDDDDILEEDTLVARAIKKLAILLNRVLMELGFFFNPKEFVSLVRFPIPVTGLLNNAITLAGDVVTLDEDTGKSLIKMVPILKGFDYTFGK